MLTITKFQNSSKCSCWANKSKMSSLKTFQYLGKSDGQSFNQLVLKKTIIRLANFKLKGDSIANSSICLHIFT